MYTAIVLNEDSRSKLISFCEPAKGYPKGWEIIAHHVTLYMGNIRQEDHLLLNHLFSINVTHIAANDLVMAVKVDNGFFSTTSPLAGPIRSDNKIAHITLAVDRANGGKPVMSNNLKDWKNLPYGLTNIQLYGRLKVCR
jgi:hypothetical protein